MIHALRAQRSVDPARLRRVWHAHPMPIDSQRVQAILFDIDGTLRDTDDEVVVKLVSVTKRVLGTERATRVMRRLVMLAESPTQAVLGIADRLNLDGPLNRLIDYLAPHGPTRAIPGVVDMVAELRGQYRLGVVSAGPKRAVERFLTEHNLREAMEFVAVGGSYRRTKPHPMPILEAAQALGVPVESVLMVGDTTVDIKAGNAAGAQTFGVTSGFGRRRDLTREHADDIADSAAILPRVLGHVGGVAPAPH
jgi:phosphoglycolate phosphatase